MPVASSALLFAAAAAVSLGSSYLLVIRLERIGQRLGLSEALLGMVAALAADAPEITSAVTALVRHQGKIGAGVIIGSNVFNLAALLGLGAVVAGQLALHRKVVLLGGVVAGWIALVCLVTVLGWIPVPAGMVAVLAVLLPYVAVLGMGGARLRRPRRAVLGRAAAWLAVAVTEEEQELEEAIHPRRGHVTDLLMAAVALVIVVLASVLMEREASALGSHFGIPEIITGGFVLAAVTSLPNAVAAVYLAARGRGAAMLSTTLNSNALNVAAGLLLPALITGLSSPSPEVSLIAAWYLVLTVAALGFAYRDRGVRRATGFFIIGSYLVFLGSLVAIARSAQPSLDVALLPLLIVIVAAAAVLARGRPSRSTGGRRSG